METSYNLQLPSTTKRIGGSQDLQDRLLAQLSESLPSRPKPRNPLSKFTITSPNHFHPSCQDPIPAYRTFAQESLSTISPEDKKRLNISPVSGMSYCISSRGNQDQARSNSLADDLKTRRCLLQKKTIHRSLEDLCNASRKRNRPFDDLLSPRSRKSNPFSCWDSSLRHDHGENENCKQKRNGNQNLAQVLPPVAPVTRCCQRKKLTPHHENETDNIIDTMQNEQRYNISGSGPDGDFVPNILSKTNEEEIEESLRNLSIENELLKSRTKEERKKCTFYRVVNAFAFEALRRRSQQLVQVEQTLLQRREECAARIILHHLLLNSWRMTKCQVKAIAVENTQLHKTIDNQSLQLNVIRKMQSIEKDKTVSVLKDYGDVKRNYCQTIKENEAMKEEYAKVLEEKRSLERHLRSLSDENCRLNTDLQIRLDKKEMQLRSMELDRFRAEKFSKENEQLTKESELARRQIKELTTQQAHWQEKALSFESQCFELKQEMESRNKAYERVLHEKGDFSRENEILSLSKCKLEKAVEEAQVKLVESTEQQKHLEKSYNECKEELEDLEDQVEYLQSALRQYKKENIEIRQKLYDCTLKNVKRRRVWGAALYFLVNPIEAFKRLYFGTPDEIHQSNRIARLSSSRKTEQIPDEKISES